MTIRKYTALDGLAVIDLWNTCLSADMIDEENFYKRVICDMNFDPDLFLLAEEDGELLGFVYGAKRIVPDEMAGLQPDQAWISAMGVRSEQRGKGIGKALLTALEAALLNRGAKSITLGVHPTNYFFPGVDQGAYGEAIDFFKAQGYNENSSCVSMDLSLRGYQTPQRYLDKREKLIKEGYIFRPYRLQDSLPIFALLREHFPHWVDNVRESILAGRAEKTLILAWNPEGEVVGFVMRAMDGTEERFGPFGVHPSTQGTGVGGVLFHEMMKSMVAQRIFYTYFLWTGGRNLDIYGTWDMKIYRTYTMMSKTL